MPASRVALYMAAEVASSASPPKDMVPKQSSETATPVRPRGLFFMRAVYLGRTQLSDHARQALLESRSPRFSAYGVPAATFPFSDMRAAFAGKKVLNTPIGRPPEPGGMVRMKAGW